MADKDLVQKDVAVAMGVAPSVVSYWMRGSIPRSKMRARIEKWSHGRIKASLAESKKKAA